MSYLLETRFIQEHPSIQHERHKSIKDFYFFFLSMLLGDKNDTVNLMFAFFI